jgi:hypothetical protein
VVTYPAKKLAKLTNKKLSPVILSVNNSGKGPFKPKNLNLNLDSLGSMKKDDLRADILIEDSM